MARQYFGTDGIRGRINKPPMTAETALRLAIAAARTFAPEGGRDVVIGRDTRRSGEMIEASLIAGLTSMGVRPVRLGVVPTPAVALTARETGAALGFMVSASHNKYEDNGLKLFSPEGVKFSDAVQLATNTLRPHFLGLYLYELAGDYSTFYAADKVIVDDPAVRARRLLLCHRTLVTLETGLHLLGLRTLERM